MSLTPELESRVKAKVETGLYNNASEVIREAFRFMETCEDWVQGIKLTQLRKQLKVGVNQLDRGEGIAVESRSALDTLFDGLLYEELNFMASHQLVIAPAAKNDLKEICQYGLRQRGQSQSERYLSTIKNQPWWLTRQPLMGIERSELLPGARRFPAESHTLFYRLTTRKVEIIRVLHGRQGPRPHLK